MKNLLCSDNRKTGFSAFPVALCCIFFIGMLHVKAQTGIYSFDSNQKTREITVPSGYSYLYLELKGADGGKPTSNNTGKGGEGAFASGYVKIGSAYGEVPVGSTIRFIPGQAGHSGSQISGGGGGSAVIFRGPNSDFWQLLLVAGGGGGGGPFHDGKPGTNNITASDGTNGTGSNTGELATNGNGGQFDGVCEAYPGGGALSNGSGACGGKAGFENKQPTGGSGGGGSCGDGISTVAVGGFGFGGGGSGVAPDTDYYGGGGGGGGYSGGGGGFALTGDCVGTPGGGGGGGGSFADPGLIFLPKLVANGTVINPQNGHTSYLFTNDWPIKTIHMAADPTKCLDVYGGGTDNGTNIQLWDCNGTGAQNWVFDGLSIRLAKDENKCIDLTNSNTTNGTNIQLYDFNNTDAQKWIYDGVYKLIRSKVNFNKCLHISNGSTTPGSNIYINDCNPASTAQQWLIDDATTKPGNVNVFTIRPTYAQGKCLDLDSGNTSNGTNIQLWDCNGTSGNTNQQWYFDGLQIKLFKDSSKCLDLSGSNTSDGTNIQLYNCNNTNAQHWVYSGLTRELRSTVNLNKCIDVANGGTSNGTNIQLNNCAGLEAQYFILSPVP